MGEDLHALSTNDVVCDVGQGTCRDIWVTIGPIGNLLGIDTNDYTIATANEREIITHPRELRCVAYTLRVNRVLEQMTLLRTTTSKDDGCEYLDKREFHMHLGNGIERLAKYNEHWREALAFLTPPPGVLAPFDAGTAESRDAASR